MQHTYVGDLVVKVSHGGRDATLHDRTGGSMDDLMLDVQSDAFSGTDAAGDWVLHVADVGGSDTGAVVRWSVTLP